MEGHIICGFFLDQDKLVASDHYLANSDLVPGANRALVIVHWAGAFSPDFNENDFLLLRKTMHEEDLRSWLYAVPV